MNLQYDRIEQLCQKLNLPAIASQWSHHAQQILGQDGSYADFVEAILTHEYAARQQRSQQVLMKLSGLPQVKTLEDYDFNYALKHIPIPIVNLAINPLFSTISLIFCNKKIVKFTYSPFSFFLSNQFFNQQTIHAKIMRSLLTLQYLLNFNHDPENSVVSI